MMDTEMRSTRILTADQQELIARLDCPLRWNAACPEQELQRWLHFAWYAVAQKYQVDREVDFLVSNEDFRPDIIEITELDCGETRTALINVRRWYVDAVREYLTSFTRLFTIRAASPAIYGRHYSKNELSRDEVNVASARFGKTILNSHVSVEIQQDLFFGRPSTNW